VNKKRFEIFNLPIEEQKFEHIQFVFYIGTQVKEWYIGGGVTFLSCRSLSRSTNLDFNLFVRFKATSSLNGALGRGPRLCLVYIFWILESLSFFKDA
jgi:hypothetical protein